MNNDPHHTPTKRIRSACTSGNVSRKSSIETLFSSFISARRDRKSGGNFDARKQTNVVNCAKMVWKRLKSVLVPKADPGWNPGQSK
jgi:hypothetical protein